MHDSGCKLLWVQGRGQRYELKAMATAMFDTEEENTMDVGSQPDTASVSFLSPRMYMYVCTCRNTFSWRCVGGC